MGFNGGGANTGGVASVEQGILKQSSSNVSITADGVYSVDFLVPAGKKWILKVMNCFKSTGTYTMGNISPTIYPDGTNGASMPTATATLSYVIPSVITLEAGAKISFATLTVASYSVTGNYTCRIIYQEVDA